MIQVVAKAAAILNVLGETDEASFTEVWQRTALNKTTVAHLLGTLHDLGYVEKQPNGCYRVGQRILTLASRRLRRNVMTELAQAQVLAVAADLGETVTIATLEAGDRHKLAKASANTEPVLDDAPERKINIFDTVTGRALLAFADAAGRQLALARHGMPGEHWPEVQSPGDLQAALDAIRHSGMATRRLADGRIESMAVPVAGPDGRVCAVIGSATSAATGKPDGDRKRLARLRAASKQLTELMKLRFGDGARPSPVEA